jgi:hypothetical protein
MRLQCHLKRLCWQAEGAAGVKEINPLGDKANIA